MSLDHCCPLASKKVLKCYLRLQDFNLLVSVVHQAPQVPIMTEWSPASTAPTALPTPLSSSHLAPRYPWNQADEIAQLRGELVMNKRKTSEPKLKSKSSWRRKDSLLTW
ncbi:hypothetical protein B9Z55_027553 [Caenorhabditis nigoni]|uniref:Uncharacterized protein n=1 Tax=Caenorhabditis nigoni TaxID=1611254 RepID=A0A2G5SFM5_9PELO|nr:hypothetical protein B9Z55_027553 [Caenorhabditis nigoni]